MKTYDAPRPSESLSELQAKITEKALLFLEEGFTAVLGESEAVAFSEAHGGYPDASVLIDIFAGEHFVYFVHSIGRYLGSYGIEGRKAGYAFYPDRVEDIPSDGSREVTREELDVLWEKMSSFAPGQYPLTSEEIDAQGRAKHQK